MPVPATARGRRGRDGAAALAAARSAQDPDRRQHRRRRSISGATASTSTGARWSSASRTSRLRKSRRRSSGWSPIRPGRCPIRSPERARRQEPGVARPEQFPMKDGYYVQQPGPKNSLGLVKFDMDDKYAIYLHDTPAKALFGAARPAPQPRLRAGRECAAVRAALAQQQGVLDEFNKASRKRRRNLRQADARSPSACFTTPLSWTVTASSSGRTITSSTIMSRARCGSNPGRSASRRSRKARTSGPSIQTEGAGLAPAPSSPSRRDADGVAFQPPRMPGK